MKTKEALRQIVREKFKDLTKKELKFISASILRAKSKHKKT